MILTRFAPAPTGRLHLGHVVNAIYVWGVAAAAGGRVLLRIEDHDRQRSRASYEAALLDDLAWLGFAPDEPSIAAFRAGRCEGRQSDRTAAYEAALASLRAKGLVYACDCARRVARYPGTCAGKGLAEGPGLSTRVRLAPSVERFDDLLHGPQAQRPSEQCGDLVVRDRQGNWTYQFAAAVDDAAQAVTLVVRGDDLLASTGRQIQLARLLGRAVPPRFLHHPLVMKSAAEKLSKSDGDAGVAELRLAGWPAARVIGLAAARVGLVPGDRSATADEVGAIPAIRLLGAALSRA